MRRGQSWTLTVKTKLKCFLWKNQLVWGIPLATPWTSLSTLCTASFKHSATITMQSVGKGLKLYTLIWLLSLIKWSFQRTLHTTFSFLCSICWVLKTTFYSRFCNIYGERSLIPMCFMLYVKLRLVTRLVCYQEQNMSL